MKGNWYGIAAQSVGAIARFARSIAFALRSWGLRPRLYAARPLRGLKTIPLAKGDEESAIGNL